MQRPGECDWGRYAMELTCRLVSLEQRSRRLCRAAPRIAILCKLGEHRHSARLALSCFPPTDHELLVPLFSSFGLAEQDSNNRLPHVGTFLRPWPAIE